MQYITTPPPVKTQRFRPLTVFLALCVSLVLVESYLPNAPAQTRPELPGCVMLAALPHRRLPGESPARATGVAEAVCSNTVHVQTAGFTLIELSIVLVIIGLLVGGVLTGQDLIRSAEVRAQVTQIEKYNSAVNTFRGKYNAVPGDMRPEIASQFGFNQGTGCNGGAAQRDGNGLIDGGGPPFWFVQGDNETGLFWQDLSSSGLIDGTYPNSGAALVSCSTHLTLVTTTMGQYFPIGKLGHGTFIYVYETSGYNWFGMSAATSVNSSGALFSNASMPVIQAYKIDNKIDDGLPTSGNVQATYLNNTWMVSTPSNAPNSATAGGDSTSCYDTSTGTYSTTYNNGSNGNCALSVKMQ